MFLYQHKKTTQTHTSSQPKPHVSFIAPLTVAVMLALSSGCTNDTSNTVRVIEEPSTDKDSTEKKTTAYRTFLTTPTNGAALELYDVKKKKVLGTGTTTIATKPKVADKPTRAEKGLETSIEVNNKEKTNGALLLVTLTAPTTGSAEYYDPSLKLDTTDKTTNATFPKDVVWMSLTAGTSAAPSPLTTLAIYRMMARLGWFYIAGNESKLPSPDDIKSFLATQNDALVTAQYTQSILELNNSLAIIGTSSIESPTDLVKLANDGTSGLTELDSWLYLLAQIKLFYNQPNVSSSAPFATFARDLAVDFLDGDLDGQSLNHMSLAFSPITEETKQNYVVSQKSTSQHTNEATYRKQFAVLNAHEAKLKTEMTKLGDMLGIANTANFKNILKTLDISDAAFFPTNNATAVGAPLLNILSRQSILVIPNNSSATKMTVSYAASASTQSNPTTITLTKTKVDDKDVWKRPADIPKEIGIDESSGRIAIPRSLVGEDTTVTAINYDNEDKQLGKITQTSNTNATLTYSDYASPRAKGKAYFGIGNQTRALDLAEGTNYRNSLNADENATNPNGFPVTDIDTVIGKYTGSSCELIVNTTGEVSLTVSGTTYTTLVDREIGDSLYAILDDSQNKTGDFMLNVSSKNNDTSERRFIQIRVNAQSPSGQKPVSAATAIAESANAMPLANPDASCTFS